MPLDYQIPALWSPLLKLFITKFLIIKTPELHLVNSFVILVPPIKIRGHVYLGRIREVEVKERDIRTMLY